MKPHERVMAASKELAAKYPADKITFADVADLAEVHWTTVRRHFGSKEEMREKLVDFQDPNLNHHLDTRTKIVKSAGKVFGELGYEGATLDLIAENAGLTKGAVYWHFSSKGDLFIELINESLTSLLEDLPAQLEEVFHSSRPEEAIKRLLHSQFQACEEEKSQQPTLFFEFISRRRDSEVRIKLDEVFAKLFSGTEIILKDLQKRKMISDKVDARSLSVTLHGLINGMVLMWTVSPSSVPLTQMVDSISKIIWDGLNPK